MKSTLLQMDVESQKNVYTYSIDSASIPVLSHFPRCLWVMLTTHFAVMLLLKWIHKLIAFC